MTSALAALLLLATACGSDKAEIEQTAYGYLDAMGNYRFEEAIPYASQRTIETTIDFFSGMLPHTDTAYIASNTPAKITIKGVHQTSDTTAYALFHKSTPITQQDDTLRLVKEQGLWKANVVIQVPANIPIPGKNVRREFTPEQLRSMKPVKS